MNEKISFIKALAGVCCGISIFRKLRFQSWPRIIFHVILMAIAASLLITTGEIQRKRPVFQAARTVFEQVFGDEIRNISAGFVPKKDPSTERYMTLPDNGRLWYCPDGRIKASLNELEKNNLLLFWAPKGLASALRKTDNTWTVSILKPGDDGPVLSRARTLSTADLRKLELDSKESWEIDDDIKSFSTKELSAAFNGIMTMGLFIQNLLLTLVLPVLYTGIFVGMFRLTSGGKFPIRLTFKEFWKIGFYAGFPATLVASAFPALDLPYLSFSTVFMIGLLSYWLYAATRLERELFITETGADENDCL